MKITILLLASLLSVPARADALTAVPFARVLERALGAELVFVEHGLAFGFENIESCLWRSRDVLVLNNYCFPKGNYPARGLEIWSREFGVIRVYEEKLGGGIVKRDLGINEFPESVAPTFPDDFRELDLRTVNEISEKLYKREHPGCWSTNYDQATGKKQAGCYKEDINRFPAWREETQRIVNRPSTWNSVLARLLAKVKTPEIP